MDFYFLTSKFKKVFFGKKMPAFPSYRNARSVYWNARPSGGCPGNGAPNPWPGDVEPLPDIGVPQPPEPLLYKQAETYQPLVGAYSNATILGPGYGTKVIYTRRNDIYKYTTGGLINVPEHDVQWSSSIAFQLRVGNSVVQFEPIELPSTEVSRWTLELTFSFDDEHLFVISSILKVGDLEFRQLGRFFDRPSDETAEFDVSAQSNNAFFNTTFGTLTHLSSAM
jgi:hypothetical protein